MTSSSGLTRMRLSWRLLRRQIELSDARVHLVPHRVRLAAEEIIQDDEAVVAQLSGDLESGGAQPPRAAAVGSAAAPPASTSTSCSRR